MTAPRFVPVADLPASILDRAGVLAELHRAHPGVGMVEAAQVMTQMLHIAVHRETWARSEAPASVWLGLLGEVVRMRGHQGAVGATLAEVVCPRCSACVSVECGDVAGLTLDDMIGRAADTVGCACPDHSGRGPG